MRSLFLPLVPLLFFPLFAAQAPVKEPQEIVRETSDRVIEILKGPVFKDPARRKESRQQIIAVLLDTVDMKRVSALCLGKHRKKFSPEELDQFVDVFSKLLFSTYVSHLEKYSDEEVVIVGTRKVAKDRVRVMTKTMSKDRQIPIDFSLSKKGDTWVLYDVRIEGVSLVKNYRSQFDTILIKKSPKQFLDLMRKKVKDNEE